MALAEIAALIGKAILAGASGAGGYKAAQSGIPGAPGGGRGRNPIPSTPPFNPAAASAATPAPSVYASAGRTSRGQAGGGGLLSQVASQAAPSIAGASAGPAVAASSGGAPQGPAVAPAPREPQPPPPGTETSEQPFLLRPGPRSVVEALSSLGGPGSLFSAVNRGAQAYRGERSRASFNRYLDEQIEAERNREGGPDEARLDALMASRHGQRYLPSLPDPEAAYGRAAFQDQLIRRRERAREERRAERRAEDPEVQLERQKARIFLKIGRGEALSPSERALLDELQRIDPFDRLLRGGGPLAGQAGAGGGSGPGQGGDPLQKLEELYPAP